MTTYPNITDKEIPEDATCQETYGMIGDNYLLCAKPAVAIIKSRDLNAYYMCLFCASHNIQNRGAKLIFTPYPELRSQLK